MDPGDPHTGNGGWQQQNQRQVSAPNSRKCRTAEHILRYGGETRNVEVRHVAVRAAGEQAGRCVEIPAQRPRPGKSFDGGIPVGEYLVAIGEHGAVTHLDQRVTPGIGSWAVSRLTISHSRIARDQSHPKLALDRIHQRRRQGRQALRGASSSVPPA